MSRPPNPLASFRSFSYYHVLAICESSQAADELAKIVKPDKWLHPAAVNPNLGDADTFGSLGSYAVKYVNEKQKTGRHCILINGATDATFTIARAKWSSATAADATIMDRSTSIAIEGELDISEPKGVVFLDVLVRCCLALEVDSANVVFLLKTFFVGESDDLPNTAKDPGSPSYITDIEPLRFIVYDVTGSFAATGGQYHMSFVALTHGASRLPQYGKSASGLYFSAGESLETTFKNLETVVADNYDELFHCVQRVVPDSEIKSLLTKVTYTFCLHKVYKEDGYKVSDSVQQVKDTEKCGDESKLTIPANMSIEDAIHLIMRRCPKVTEEAALGVGVEGNKIHYEYKIHSGISSERGFDGKVQYTVHYFVERFMRPKDVSLFDIAGKIVSRDLTELTDSEEKNLTEGEQRLRDNLIAFDYIYTGKNIDILEFEMKMNLGLAYLQIATINNTLKEQLQTVPTGVTHVNELDPTVRFGKPTQIPVFFGTQIRSPTARNSQKPSEKAGAEYTLSKHASLEVSDVTMKIYGNPRLVGTVNATSNPDLLCGPELLNPELHEPKPSTPRVANFNNWSHFPSFVKLNIKMPRNNDDISLFTGELVTDSVSAGGRDFTREFWFTGFYYVIGIEHLFEGGEFTQIFSMLGMPESNATKALNRQGHGAGEIDTNKRVLECYDSRVDPCAKGDESGRQVSGGLKLTAAQIVEINTACAQAAAAAAAAAAEQQKKVCTENTIPKRSFQENAPNAGGTAVTGMLPKRPLRGKKPT